MQDAGEEPMLAQPTWWCGWFTDQGAQGGIGGGERRRSTQPPLFLKVASASDLP